MTNELDDLRYENRHLRAMVRLQAEQIQAMQERREAEAAYDEILASSRNLDDEGYSASDIDIQETERIANMNVRAK